MRDIQVLYQAHLQQLLSETGPLLESLGYQGLLVASGSPRPCFLDDHDYPFVVNPHFKRWLPLTDNPHCYLLLRVGERPRLLYHQPRDYWHAAAGAAEGYWVDSFDIEPVADAEAALKTLAGWDLHGVACIAEAPEPAAELPGVATNPPALMAALHYARACKSEYELHCLREANRIAAKGHRAARDAFFGGDSELEVHLRYLAACGHTEAQSPYGNIVAFNQNAAILHNDRYGVKPPAQRHSFLIDAGATFEGYIADITRTYAAREGLFADLVARMDQEQQGIASEVKAGVEFVALHERMHQRLAAVLSDSGILNCDADTAFGEGITRLFFPHGLGHLIGLQTHDVGGWQINAAGDRCPPHSDYPALRLQRTLQERMAVTIEPGLYFIDQLLEPQRENPHLNWPLIDTLRPCGGIRIEDTLVALPGGAENLTRPAFTALD
ncbi:Xaa-Pro dipeptidase [Aestuariirhabdus litorea]|uniref:Xaa-Pro dipeptidase n=1 Tax=Aestuariirhabdus litorea TaxID=2528527 RepID=A0A3P3VMK1_9GAMM|nr:Xaa-Pro dipeptidase [Aestuariirhabdus litorea]RRJ83850.1 Xaa-Pro dipeptidase [Aestuariirhabdus litorea]RWW97073.1 Xaa-Pro dipeptidase [Endozoicomonadaceae bacterium GTF-13]